MIVWEPKYESFVVLFTTMYGYAGSMAVYRLNPWSELRKDKFHSGIAECDKEGAISFFLATSPPRNQLRISCRPENLDTLGRNFMLKYWEIISHPIRNVLENSILVSIEKSQWSVIYTFRKLGDTFELIETFNGTKDLLDIGKFKLGYSKSFSLVWIVHSMTCTEDGYLQIHVESGESILIGATFAPISVKLSNLVLSKN